MRHLWVGFLGLGREVGNDERNKNSSQETENGNKEGQEGDGGVSVSKFGRLHVIGNFLSEN